jgi:hypothetical protein
MKKAIAVLALFALGAAASSQALAWGGGPRVSFGVHIGVPLWGPWYPPYPPYYYPPPYPPVVVAPAPPTYVERPGYVERPPYIEQQNAPQRDDPNAWWYYCADSKSYYPYVKQCAGAWQRVSPRPPQ